MGETCAIIYGVGTMGRLTARLLLERGVRITGAIGHRNNVGRDLGEVIGWDRPLGVLVTADADEVLGEVPADIAILSVGETMEQAYPHLRKCVEAGMNVFSLSEQVFFPWRCAPELAADIDALAKEHGVTVSAGGIQDVFWVNLMAVLSGASQSITSIEGVAAANVDDYGLAVAEDAGIGGDPGSFEGPGDEGDARANVFTITLEALAADLGFTVTGWEQGLRPLIATTPVMSTTLGRVIKPGQILGLATSSRVKTEEGAELIGEIHLKVFDKGDSETHSWVVRGEPTLHLECRELPGPVGTCTAVVNRIPDVIAAPAGLVTVDRLPKPKFKQRV